MPHEPLDTETFPTVSNPIMMCVAYRTQNISPLFSAGDYAPFIFSIDCHYCGCVFIRASPVNNKRSFAERYWLLLKARASSRTAAARCRLCGGVLEQAVNQKSIYQPWSFKLLFYFSLALLLKLIQNLAGLVLKYNIFAILD